MTKFTTFFLFALFTAASAMNKETQRELKIDTDLGIAEDIEGATALSEPDQANESTMNLVEEVDDLQEERDLGHHGHYGGHGGGHGHTKKHCSYKYYPGAIRTRHWNKGSNGHDFHVYHHVSKDWCRKECSKFHWCYAYEYYAHDFQCELWKYWSGNYDSYKHGFGAYVKYGC